MVNLCQGRGETHRECRITRLVKEGRKEGKSKEKHVRNQDLSDIELKRKSSKKIRLARNAKISGRKIMEI